VLGGKINNTGSFAQGIERAQVNIDGSLTPFQFITGATLRDPRAWHTSVVVGNRVYVIGGELASGVTDTIESALIR
jgi:hypothetical protein